MATKPGPIKIALINKNSTGKTTFADPVLGMRFEKEFENIRSSRFVTKYGYFLVLDIGEGPLRTITQFHLNNSDVIAFVFNAQDDYEAQKAYLTDMLKLAKTCNNPSFTPFLFVANAAKLTVEIEQQLDTLAEELKVTKENIFRECSFVECASKVALQKRRWSQSFFNPKNFKESYLTIWNNKAKDSDLARAIAVLEDYANKGFFHFHWNRQHAKAVKAIIAKTTITSTEDLLTELDKITKNSTGSLAKRIAFIRYQTKSVESKEMKGVTSHAYHSPPLKISPGR